MNNNETVLHPIKSLLHSNVSGQVYGFALSLAAFSKKKSQAAQGIIEQRAMGDGMKI